MLTLFRWLLRLTVGLIVLGVLAALLVWYFAVRSLPDYGATYTVPGISAPVEIVRSTENVPHIFGASDRDVFFALGVAHAQDRLFQMTVLRRAAQGRLSEIYGPEAFAADDTARRLGLHRRAQAALTAQDAPTREALAAYADGVNQWIAQVNEGAMGRGAPEFFLFPGQIAYWQPADSLSILKLLAAARSHAALDEVLRARLSLADPDHGPDILAHPRLPAVPAYADMFPGVRMNVPQAGHDPDDRRLQMLGYLAPGAGIGATGFAAAADRTAAGGALLASAPVVGLTAPSLYYLARLQLQSGGVIGATIPGMPLIVSGRNPALAWGITPADLDDADIAIEEVQPGNPDRYRGEAGWTDFSTRTEVIRILDSHPRSITLRETQNGPVIPGLVPGMDDVVPAGHVAALRWIGLAPDDTTMSALMGVMRAGAMADAERALDQAVAPVLDVTLADDRGVRQIRAGRAPVRAPDQPGQGLLPVPGWLAGGRWRDVAPVSPDAVVAPVDGMAIATDEAPGGMRRARLERLLADREVHSRDSFIAAQLDTVSPAARALLPLVGADLWFTGEPAAPGTPERQRQDALRLLAEWDGEMSEHLPEPLIYAAWMTALQDRLIRDDIGPLADDLDRIRPSFIEAVFRNRAGAARWCNIVQSAQTEDCTTIARQALDRAILDLTARFGPDVTSWRWGDAHQALHLHPGLGDLGGLSWIVNLTQSVSGGDFTVAQSGLLGHGPNPWQAVSGAGYRGVYDLADPDSSVFIISTGQSGHPLSRHYDDMAGLWRRGEYVGMSLDPQLARAASVGVTTLIPAHRPDE